MTFDIYNNRIPFALLTNEERAALRAHKGKFEFCNDATVYQWRLVMYHPSWFYATSYRAVKEQLRPADPPWHVLNDQIQYVARNEDGVICGYSGKPIRGEKQWLASGYRFWSLSPILKFNRGNMPWDQSLVIRPLVTCLGVSE